MKTKNAVLLTIGLLLVAGISYVVWAFNYKENCPLRNFYNTTINKVTKTPIIVGWQTHWTTQGPLMSLIKRLPGIFSKNDLAATYSESPDAATFANVIFMDGVDVFFSPVSSAISFISKNPNWVVIGRFFNNRIALYAPPKSSIKTSSDLAGKSIGVAFGSEAHRVLLRDRKDVKLVNITLNEQQTLVKDKNATKWGSLDALAGSDPALALFEENGLAKTIQTDKELSVVVMSRSFMNKYPQGAQEFLRVYKENIKIYKNNPAEANDWYNIDHKLSYSQALLKRVVSVEPDLLNADDVRVGFTDKELISMQESADFLLDQKIIQKKIDMKNVVDLKKN